jgi:hypothetical protein
MTENGSQEDTLVGTIRKEIRVVLSRHRSPLPLRVAKLVMFALVSRRPPADRVGCAPGLPAHDAGLNETVGWLERRGGGETQEGLGMNASKVGERSPGPWTIPSVRGERMANR